MLIHTKQCIHIHIYVRMHQLAHNIDLHTYTSTYTHIHINTCTNTNIYARTHKHASPHIYIHKYWSCGLKSRTSAPTHPGARTFRIEQCIQFLFVIVEKGIILLFTYVVFRINFERSSINLLFDLNKMHL